MEFKEKVEKLVSQSDVTSFKLDGGIDCRNLITLELIAPDFAVKEFYKKEEPKTATEIAEEEKERLLAQSMWNCCFADDEINKERKEEMSKIYNTAIKNPYSCFFDPDSTFKTRSEFDKLKNAQIQFNGPVTVLIKDGKKYISRTTEGDTYDKEKGLMMCLLKYYGFESKDLRKLLDKVEKEEKVRKLAKEKRAKKRAEKIAQTKKKVK